MDWHDVSCSRPDLFTSDGLQCCLRCGSFADLTQAQPIRPSLTNKSDFRLIRLLNGEFHDDIRCEVFVEDISSLPLFDAVSYTWGGETGDASLCQIIYISGQEFRVTQSCQNALRRIRRRLSPRVIWIDAICIDQDSNQERGHQVGLMPLIYSRAREVLVYVGENKGHSEWWFDQIALGSFRWHQTGIPPFLKTRYFSRVWVLQEVALARQASLICGNVKLPWTKLLEVEVPIDNKIPLIELSKANLHNRPDQFLELLDVSRACEASDPRDKIYALLGLAIGEVGHGLVADYNLSVRQLYFNVALHLASRHGWGPVLSRAAQWSRTNLSLPSWVPDWTSTIPSEAFQRNGDVDSIVPAIAYETFQYSVHDQSLSFVATIASYYEEPDQIVAHVEGLDTPRAQVLRFPYLSQEFLDVSVEDLYLQEMMLQRRQVCSLALKKLHPRSSETDLVCQLTSVRGSTVNFASAPEMVARLNVTSHQSLVFVLGFMIDAFFRFTKYDWNSWNRHESVEAFLNDKDNCSSTQWRLKVQRFGPPWLEMMHLARNAWGAFRTTYWKNNIALWLRTNYVGSAGIRREHMRQAADFEPSTNEQVGRLWRETLARDPRRQELFDAMGADTNLWLDVNDALWRLMVRLFLSREVNIKLL